MKNPLSHRPPLFRRMFPVMIAGLSATMTALAQSSYTNPCQVQGCNTIPDFLLLLVKFAYLIAVPLVVLFIIYAGFLLLTAGDNESKVTKAKFTLMWSIIGAMLLLGAVVLSDAVRNTILSIQ